MQVQLSEVARVTGTRVELTRACELAEFPNPKYDQARRYGNGYTKEPEKIRLWKGYPDGSIEVPLGVGARVAVEERAQVVDKRISRPVEYGPLELDTLRPYQKAAINAALDVNHGLGLIQMPCGAGKTITAIAAIHALGEKTLIVVHTEALLRQWQQRIRSTLCIAAGVVHRQQCVIAPVTVAMKDTIIRWEPKKIRRLGEQFGCVFLDEAHHVAAPTFVDVIAKMPCRYRFGLSATPYRTDDALTDALFAVMGPLFSQVTHEELFAGGWLVKAHVKQFQTGVTADDQVPCTAKRCGPMCQQCRGTGWKSSYTTFVTNVTKSRRYGYLLYALIDDALDAGRHILLLSQRVEHARRIAKLFGNRAAVLTGTTKQTKRNPARDRIIDRVSAGDIRLLCATKLADEGLDIPILDTMVLAVPQKAKGTVIQQVGRIMRPHPDKAGTPTVWDPIHNHYMAERHAAARLDAYAEARADVKTIRMEL